MRPRSQRVAQAAFDRVNARKAIFDRAQPAEPNTQEKSTSGAKKYGALAHRFPIWVLQNGLAQATGFLLAKGKEEHLFLLDDLAQILRESGEAGCLDARTFHAAVIAADTSRTMHLTRRTLEASGWVKRYVQGVLKVDAAGDNAEQENAI